MPPSQDSHSQPKRPSLVARQSSASSAVSQSPSDGPSQRPGHNHKPHKYVVGHGHGRLGRNASFGKNLNKLNKLTPAHTHTADAGTANAKHHRRSLSGTSTPSGSPRPGVKRNASSMGIIRNTSHTHIRKNHSSGHLPRQASSKNMQKSTKSEAATPKRSLMKSSKEQGPSPQEHPSVRFDIGDDENPDDAWTEESASQSPTTTRSNTRQNSVIIDPQQLPPSSSDEQDAQDTQDTQDTQDAPVLDAGRPQMQTPPRVVPRDSSDHSAAAQEINGGSSYKPSRPPDADIITSRLLRRSGSHQVPPQMSSVSATVVSESHEPRSLSHSQGSTLAETPGKDLVSRFMDGEGSSSAARDSSFLPSRTLSKSSSAGLDPAKRNKSAPNITESSLLHNRTPSRPSTTTTPTDLNPSRTQQKLWLQRASSNIEPQKMIPIILPRTGGPQLLGAAVSYAATGEGRKDPRLQRQFDQVSLEYKVVRRYRNPLADALGRLDQLPPSVRKAYNPSSPIKNGHISGSLGSASGRNSRAGLRSSRPAADGFDDADDIEGRQSFESEGERVGRTEADEICRRLWDSTGVSDQVD